MSEGYKIRYYTDMDEAALSSFFERVWTPPSLKKSADWLRWQLSSNPHVQAGMPPAILAYHDSLVIGMIILIPTPIWIDGYEHLATWTRDLYMDPEYRRHKVGLLIENSCIAAYEAALSSGQSKIARNIQKQRGWTEIAHINQNEKLYYDRQVLKETLAEGAGKMIKRIAAMLYAKATSSFASGYSWCKVLHNNDFDPRVDELWQICRSEYSHICGRDIATLRWRFVDHPYYRYTVSEAVDADGNYRGYLVSRREGSVCWIVDLLTRREDFDIRCALIAELEHKAHFEGATRFICRSVCAPVEKALRNRGFLSTPFVQQYFTAKSTAAFPFGTAANWYITAMDSDLDR